MADIQTFNETFLGNANVPQTGSKTATAPPSVGGSATGMPAAVQKSDGLDNPRANTMTKQAGPRSVPSTGAKFRPAAVQTFTDGAV